MDNLGTIVLATGALGTASFGIVEALKWTLVGVIGFREIPRSLGEGVMMSLETAYGTDATQYLKSLYRKGRTSGELLRAIRQGARVGLRGDATHGLDDQLGAVVDSEALEHIAEALGEGKDLSDTQMGVLGRYELALDARVEAALARADSIYVGAARSLAAIVSIVIALAAWLYPQSTIEFHQALIVGVAAGPLAPIVKDASKAMNGVAGALSRRLQ